MINLKMRETLYVRLAYLQTSPTVTPQIYGAINLPLTAYELILFWVY